MKRPVDIMILIPFIMTESLKEVGAEINNMKVQREYSNVGVLSFYYRLIKEC